MTTLEDIKWVFEGEGDGFNCYVESNHIPPERYYILDFKELPDTPTSGRIHVTLDNGTTLMPLISEIQIEGVALTKRYERHKREAEEL